MTAATTDRPDAESGINEFALVTYVPQPLGSYLDLMRKELAPWMPPGRSHITVLPPRPLAADPTRVWEGFQRKMSGLRAFTVIPTGIEMFNESGAVYLAVDSGSRELSEMYRLLNSDDAAHEDAYPFHPHITVAHGPEAAEVRHISELARRMWSDYEGPRSFVASSFYFVQNTFLNLWMDLGKLELACPET